MFYTIYKITNKINGKIYIGKHQTKDLNDYYMGSGKHLSYAIEKYGIENFDKEILFNFDNEADMNAKEAELVTEEFCLREDTYNLCPGGKGGWGYINNEIELRISKNRKARLVANNSIKQKYNVDNISQHEETKKKISSSIKNLYETGKKISYFNSETNKQMNMRSQSEEAKRKRSETMKKKMHQSGEKNSQFGSIWISNGLENKKIKISETIPEGWYRGRK